MSTRRRLLLALLSAFKWVVNRFTYIYNYIVPSGDYKKARLGKIEGNGEIVNQLVSDSATSYTFNDTNKYLKRISGTYSLYTGVAGTTISVSGGSDMVCDLTKQFGTGNEPTSLDDNRVKRIIAKGYIPYNTGTYDSSVVKEIEYSRLPDEYQEVEYLESSGAQYIDTNLKLIDFDTLESKFSVNTVVSGVRSACGTRNQNNTAFTFIRFDSNYFTPYFGVSMETNILFSAYDKHKIKVKATNGEQTVYVDDILVATRQDSLDKTGNNNVWFFGFNNNGVISTSTMPIRAEETKFISGNTLVRDFIPCYRKADKVAGLYDLVNNVFYTNQGTGTFAVGSDIPSNKLQLPQPIKLNGAINAHDTFEVLSDSYRFTRNVWNVDLGSLNYTKSGGVPQRFSTSGISSLIAKPDNNDTLCNTLCVKYVSSTWNTMLSGSPTNMSVAVSNNGTFYIANEDFFSQTAEQLKTAVSGIPLYYALATPQVISIPKKHLGAIKLKDLSWTRLSGSGVYYFRTASVITDKALGNIFFTSKYKTLETVVNENMTISGSYATKHIYIRDDSYSTVDDFLASLTDKDILFFETANEVQDFTNSLDIQSGGFLNAKQLNDVICEVLPNVELEMRK